MTTEKTPSRILTYAPRQISYQPSLNNCKRNGRWIWKRDVETSMKMNREFLEVIFRILDFKWQFKWRFSVINADFVTKLESIC